MLPTRPILAGLLTLGVATSALAGVSVTAAVAQDHGRLAAQTGAATRAQLDPTFTHGTANFDGPVNSSVMLSDGKVLVVGNFQTVQGREMNGIVRLNSDGRVDETFRPGSGFEGGAVSVVKVQSDGKILVGGWFQSYDGIKRNKVARLLPDGRLDKKFDPGSGLKTPSEGPDAVLAIEPTANGQLLLGGYLSKREESTGSSQGLVRVTKDGHLDSSFRTEDGFDGPVTDLISLAGGGAVASGSFETFNGFLCGGVARLTSEGTRERSFNPEGTGFQGEVEGVVPATDGGFFIYGTLVTYNDEFVESVVKLSFNGKLDPTFRPSSLKFGPKGFVGAVALDPRGALYASYINYADATQTHICRIDSRTGAVDKSFSDGTGFRTLDVVAPYLLVRPDGKLLTCGAFESYNGEAVDHLAQLIPG